VDRVERDPDTGGARQRRHFLELDARFLEVWPGHSKGHWTFSPSRTERAGASALASREIAFPVGADEEPCEARFVDGGRTDTALLWDVCDTADLRGFLPPREDDAEWRVPVEALRAVVTAGGPVDIRDGQGGEMLGDDFHGFVRSLAGSVRARTDTPWGAEGPSMRTIRLDGDLEGVLVADRDSVVYEVMGYPCDARRELRMDVTADVEGTLVWNLALDRAVALELEGTLEVREAAIHTLHHNGGVFEEKRAWEGSVALRGEFRDEPALEER
jgi:hypothetical protein